MKQQLNEIKRMQQLAGLIIESQLDEAVDTLNIQTSNSEEGNKQITLSVLGGGWTENEITLSTEEAKALVELAKEFSGNRNNPISKGVNTSDKNSTQSIISIQPDKLSLIIGRKEGSTYKGYDEPIEAAAGYLKAQQSIVYQIVEDLPKKLSESIEEALPTQPSGDKKNIVDTKPELQKYLRDLSVKVSALKGADAKEIQFLSTIINGVIQDIEKGSLSPALQQVLKVYDSRTKNLG